MGREAVACAELTYKGWNRGRAAVRDDNEDLTTTAGYCLESAEAFTSRSGYGSILSSPRLSPEENMKILATLSVFLLLGVSGLTQSRSVWIEDLTANEVVAAVSAGKTTLIYCSGALHSDGPAITLGKHIYVAREVAQRIAEQLGNALVLPINPYAPAYQQLTSSSPMFSIVGGTVSLSDEAYGLVTKDVVNSAILAVKKSAGLVGSGFSNVMIMGDHNTGQETLQRVAKDLDLEWKSKGVRVYYIDVGPSGKTLMMEHLKKTNPGVPVARMTPIDDNSELMSVDRARVREDKIAAEDRISSPELGKIFLDFKVNTAVEQVRKLTAK
jgi:creatinine amidohydrolase